jgi:hypothetical protein
MRILTAAAVAGVLALAGCSGAEGGAPVTGGAEAGSGAAQSETGLLEAHGLGDMDAAQIIEHLDAMPVDERPADLVASVGIDALTLSDGQQEVSRELPADSVYVAFAPYVDQTHDCFYHSLTTCLGELGSEPVEVTITDADTGEVLVDEETTTFDNGFVGYWLPRDISASIELVHDGRTGSVDFATDDSGATCITTLRLTE